MDQLESPPQTPALLLSIHQLNANRIFDGVKVYELRKVLPKLTFNRVYLYESGGAGIVGYFDVESIIHQPVLELWQSVGELATTKQRFFEYFGKKWKKGFAIRVRNAVRFARPLNPEQLREHVPKFVAPQSYVVLWPHDSLYRVLQRQCDEQGGERKVALELIRPEEGESFVELVTTEISRKYEGITPAFARSILATHNLGRDPNGVLTKSKQVFSIRDEEGTHIGFTTLTHKLGGCSKTGPTVLFRRYRGKGLGAATRSAVQNMAVESGIRKLYCTCPDNDAVVMKYLLRASFRIEAHLEHQYHGDHGELVFGKVLKSLSVADATFAERAKREYEVALPSSFTRAELVRAIYAHMGSRFLGVTQKLSQSIARRSLIATVQSSEEKPVTLLCLKYRQACEGILMLLPKRGGALKALLLAANANARSVNSLIAMGEECAFKTGRRKVYFLHPINDGLVTNILLERGYIVEGVLREPYLPGNDNLVLSKNVVAN